MVQGKKIKKYINKMPQLQNKRIIRENQVTFEIGEGNHIQ